MFVIVELLGRNYRIVELQNFGEEGQEKRMTESTVTSVKVEGVMIAIESC
jgi:hypothetical protein